MLANYRIPAGEEAQIRAYFRPQQGLAVQQERPEVSIASPAPAMVAALSLACLYRLQRDPAPPALRAASRAAQDVPGWTRARHDIISRQHARLHA